MIAAPWDALTAIGTLALAGVTFAAVIVTLVITWQDRRRTDERIRAEQLRNRELEQDQQAADVYLTRTAVRLQATAAKVAPIATVVNGGDYTITKVTVRFSVGGRLADPVGIEYVPSVLASALIADTDTLGYTDVLTPGTGLRAAAALVEADEAREAVPIVRWTDRWEQPWEYRKGEVRRILPDEPWCV